ncbi:MAG: hypothetical protein WBD47_01370 [Phormidesmis sp.]
MTTPPKNIMVKCPQCQRVYIDWYTPTVGEPTAEQSPSTVCSKCGHRSRLSDLSDRNGVLQAESP